MLANVRHDVRSRSQSMTSPQPVQNCDRSRFASAQRPANHTDIGRTTSAQQLAQRPRSVRVIADRIRETVCLVDVQRPGWCPVGRPHTIRRIVHPVSNAVFVKWLEHVSQSPGNWPQLCESVTAITVCLCPRAIRVRNLSANMSVFTPQTDHDRDLSETMLNPLLRIAYGYF